MKESRVDISLDDPPSCWESWRTQAERLYQEVGVSGLAAQGEVQMIRYIGQAYGLLTDNFDGVSAYGLPVSRTYEAQTVQWTPDSTAILLYLLDENGQGSFALRTIYGDRVWDVGTHILRDPSFWFSDLDLDGTCELLLCGDTASNDYSIYGWELTATGLSALGQAEDGWLLNGELHSIQEDTLIVSDSGSVLNSLFVHAYTYDPETGLRAVPPETSIRTEPQGDSTRHTMETGAK